VSRKDSGKRVVKAVMTNPVPDAGHTSQGLRDLRMRSGKEARDLLSAVATALNACEKAGLLIQLAHGAAFSSEGYVLPVGGGELSMIGERWVARTRAMTEFPVPPSFGDED
jgi:hypothetical protein